MISETDAKLLLELNAEQLASRSADESRPTDAAGDAEDEKLRPSETFELVNMGDYKYLCSIPVLEPATGENKTATELARAEEAREESRAVASGWELIGRLEDTCLYYMSGWWSYSFCRNTEIVQYHALASSPKGQPPKRDLHSPEYVLGSVPAIPSTTRNAEDHELDPIPAELQEKGKQRYLVQRLEGGTLCDLTNRERTIEVQYHCVPGLSADRISYIKEVTICAYVMVVDTPRLCDDVAFLPPEPTLPNLITCQTVSSSASLQLDRETGKKTKFDAETEAEMEKAREAAVKASTALDELLGDPESRKKAMQSTVGDIKVGSRSLLSGADEAGRAPFKLTPPRSFLSTSGLAGEPKMQVIVAQGASDADGGEVKALSREELKKLDIDPDTVENMADQIQTLADGAGWRLEMSDSGLAGVRELKGYIDEEETEEELKQKAQAKAKREAKEKAEKRAEKRAQKAAKANSKKKPAKKEADPEPETVEEDTSEANEGQDAPLKETPGDEKVAPAEEDEDFAEEGSEEVYYKDEL